LAQNFPEIPGSSRRVATVSFARSGSRFALNFRLTRSAKRYRERIVRVGMRLANVLMLHRSGNRSLTRKADILVISDN
jgi:hypothetical protein